MEDKIEFTVTSKSIYEYLFLLNQESVKGNLSPNELESLIDTLNHYIGIFERRYINYQSALERILSE